MVAANSKIKVIWARDAWEDLRRIYTITLEFTKSKAGANAVKQDILARTRELVFTQQHQTDEFFGAPYRRMIVRQYRIVYVISTQNEVQILFIINNRNHHKKHT